MSKLLRQYQIPTTDTLGRPRTRTFLVFECDFCGAEVTKQYRKNVLEECLIFCNNECSYKARKKGQVFYQHNTKIIQERYGADDCFSSKELQQKQRETKLEKYGDPSYSNREKAKQTFQENWGADHPMKTEEGKKLVQDSTLKSLGVPFAIQHPEIKEKRRKTCFERFGGPAPASSDEVVQKMLDTKMQNNPNCFRSKSEIKFEAILRQYFAEVEIQQHVKRWPIDFYLPELDVYVQFDGVYWHGLNRDKSVIEEGAARGCANDICILDRMKNDALQAVYFKHNDLTLVRVTDLEVKNAVKSKNIEVIIKVIRDASRTNNQE